MIWIVIALAVIVIILAYFVWKMHKYLKWVSDHRRQMETWAGGVLLPYVDAICSHVQNPTNALPGCGGGGRYPPPPDPDYP